MLSWAGRSAVSSLSGREHPPERVPEGAHGHGGEEQLALLGLLLDEHGRGRAGRGAARAALLLTVLHLVLGAGVLLPAQLVQEVAVRSEGMDGNQAMAKHAN